MQGLLGKGVAATESYRHQWTCICASRGWEADLLRCFHHHGRVDSKGSRPRGIRPTDLGPRGGLQRRRCIDCPVRHGKLEQLRPARIVRSLGAVAAVRIRLSGHPQLCDKSSRFQIWFASTGTLWIDDVRFEKAGADVVHPGHVIPPGRIDASGSLSRAFLGLMRSAPQQSSAASRRCTRIGPLRPPCVRRDAEEHRDGSPVLPVGTLQPARSQGHFDKSVYGAAGRVCSATSPRHGTSTCSIDAPPRCQATPGAAMALDAFSRPHEPDPAGAEANRLNIGQKPGMLT